MSWFARSIANTLQQLEIDDDYNNNNNNNTDEIISTDQKNEQQQLEEEEEEEGDDSPLSPNRGVKEDISEITKTLTRKFWGVASFLAPPPPTEQSDERSGSDPEDAGAPEPISGIRRDFAEIGGRFRSGISKLSNNIDVSEITKLASNFLQLAPEGEAIGVTDDVVAFVRDITMHPETWLDFPLPDDEDDNEVCLMEEKNLSFVTDLDPKKDLWNMKARIIRKWRQKYTLDLILIDEKGNQIQGTVKEHLIPQFDNQLHEDDVVLLTKFGVGLSNADKFPVVKHQYKVNFYRCTSVKKWSVGFQGHSYGFKFIPLKDILANKAAESLTVDVLGCVIWCGDMDIYKKETKESKKLNIDIQDLDGTVLRCTLWDQYATDFNNFIIANKSDEHVIIAIQHGKVREWRHFELSDAQQEHALTVESLAPRLAALRIELCPGYMSESSFWKVYFVLLHPRLEPQAAELLSTPEIVKARAALTLEMKTCSNSQKKDEEFSENSFPYSEYKPASFQQEQSSVPSGSQSESPPLTESETEKRQIPSEEIQIIDKSVIQEEPRTEIKVEDKDEDDWLKEDTSENTTGTTTTTTIPIENDEDVSFSDLEEDDGDGPTNYKNGSDSSTKDSRDWVRLGSDSSAVEQARPGQVSGVRNSEMKESNDWLDVDDIDVA